MTDLRMKISVIKHFVFKFVYLVTMTTESLPNVGTQVQKDKADEDIFFNNWFHLVTRETPAENREVVSVISDRYTET